MTLEQNIKAILECNFSIAREETIESATKRIMEQIARQNPFEDIKAEIIEEKDCAYADFERYKVDYLGQEWEEVYDSLPQDDYRYGMERAVEIIDKHIKEINNECISK